MVFVHFNKVFIVDLFLLSIIAYGSSQEKRLVVVCVPASDCMQRITHVGGIYSLSVFLVDLKMRSELYISHAISEIGV